jgi:parallel beta-helix repeat protein
VIKKAHWIIDRYPITNHSGGTLTYSGGYSIYQGYDGYGFFIQNDVRTLDVQNEWYYNPSSKKIRIYSTSEPINVKVATVDNLLTATNTSYFTVNGLSLVGSNQNAIYLTKSSGDQYATITNCNIDYSGRNAIAAYKSPHLTVTYCTINHTNNTAITLDPTKVVDSNSAYALISNNSISNTGLFEGLGDNYDGVFIGIHSTSPNATIEYNSIVNTGFNGIYFADSNVLVKNNFINYTNTLKDDGAGIYTYIGNVLTVHTNRVISGNIVLNAIGDSSGTTESASSARGIYLDGYTVNVDVIDNTIANTGSHGILINASHGCKIKNNTVYNCSDQICISNWHSTFKASGLDVKNNILVSLNSKQRTLTFQAENSDLLNFGISDSNYYASVVSELAPIHVVNAGNSYSLGKPYNLKAWKTEFNKDEESNAKPKLRFEYDYTKIGVNKYANESFASVPGTKGYNNCTPTWEANGSLDTGCLKISNLTLSKNAVVTFNIGAVEFGKTYLVKFSSISSMSNSNMKVNLIENSSPYTQSIQQLTYLDTERLENQLLLKATYSSSTASVMFQLSNGDQTVWIDNLQLFEVNTTEINVDEYVQFKYNNTLSVKTLSLHTPMIDVKGIRYGNSITLQPFTSAVLMKDPSIYTTEYKSICEGSNYNGWTLSGNYIRTLIAKSNVDSIVTTILTVNPKYVIQESISIKSGENYLGRTTNQTFTRNLISKAGCDSIVTTNLTVESLNNAPIDNTAPIISAFSTPATSNSLTVSISSFTATDNIGITGYILTETSSIPTSSEKGWTASAPSTYTFLSAGSKTLYAWTKDDAGNISTSLNQVVTITLEVVPLTESSQTLILKKGYNMISTYVSAPDSAVNIVTQPIVADGNLIKIQDESGNSFENWGSFGGWINNLGSIKKTEGYKIKVAENCTLQVTGRLITLPLDITLNAGWNIISFPRTEAIDAMMVIQSLIDQNKLIKVQDEAGNSIEDWGIYGGWINGIGNFVSGKAYRVKMSASTVLTIQENYPKAANLPIYAEKTSYFSSQAEGNGVDHMNINIVGLKEAGLSDGDELAAFDGEVCVGTLKITQSNLTSGSASLVASSNTGSQLKDGFKDGTSVQLYVWNQMNGLETKVEVSAIKGLLNYQRNASILVKLKSLTTSTALPIANILKTEVYPNPSQGRFTVRFSELPEAGSRIEVLDLSGRKVASRLITRISEELNLYGQTAGLYLVKSILGSSEKIEKLVIQ